MKDREKRQPLTYAQAARRLGVTVAVVELMTERLLLLTVRVRGRRMIPPCEMRRFLSR